MCVYFLLIHHLIDDEMNLQMFCGNHSLILMLDAHTVTWSHVDLPSITCMCIIVVVRGGRLLLYML
jgi:hypothetical protein